MGEGQSWVSAWEPGGLAAVEGRSRWSGGHGFVPGLALGSDSGGPGPLRMWLGRGHETCPPTCSRPALEAQAGRPVGGGASGEMEFVPQHSICLQ